MIKYKTSSYGVKIEAVEVGRETEHFVWINGRRRSRLGQYESYFDTWRLAKAHLVDVVDSKVSKLERQLAGARNDLSAIECMTDPTGGGE